MLEHRVSESRQERLHYSTRLFARFTEVIASQFPNELFVGGSPVWDLIGPDSDRILQVAASYEDGQTSREEFNSVATEVLHSVETKIREFSAKQQNNIARKPRA